jgi:hypothetical protein
MVSGFSVQVSVEVLGSEVQGFVKLVLFVLLV